MSRDKKSKRPVEAAQGASWFGGLSATKRDLLCIAILVLLVVALFHDIVFKDMVFSTEGDTAAAQSWAKAGESLEEAEGTDPLWIPYVFSGMPGFASMAYGARSVNYIQQFLHMVGKVIFLNASVSWILVHYLLAGVGMFLLVRSLSLTHVASLFASITYMLSPYAIGLAQTGHGSKLMAVSYIPLVFLLTQRLIQQPNLLNFGLMTAAVGTFLLTGHVQIVYYGFLVIGCYLIYTAIVEAKLGAALTVKRTISFVLALGLGFAISAFVYLSVEEYAQYSIRGGGAAGVPGGLNYDYATAYSLHPFEMLAFLIPSFFGFSSPYYWGWKPFSDSSVYVGILPILLSIIALTYRRTRTTIFLAVVSVLALLMSFGNHFPVLYDLMFGYFPYFNKFRAPEMILHLIAFTAAILGAYGLTFILDLRERQVEANVEKLKKWLLYCLGGLATVLVLGLMFKSSLYETLSGFMFVKEGETEVYRQQYGQQVPQIIAQLKQQRFDLLWKDYVKFVFIAGSVVGAIILFMKKKIQSGNFAGAVILILLIDLIIIDSKLINPRPQSAGEQRFQPDATVTFLKQQEGLFRVLPFGQLWGDNTFMYHGIQSIGGYSPAKLKIYQTMVDSCLYAGPDPTLPLNMNIVNMLNVKYILAQGRLPEERFELVNTDQTKRILTYRNPGALPRAFFVQNAVVATTEHEVFRFLNSSEFNPATTAILEKSLPQELHRADSSFAEVRHFASGEVRIDTYTSSAALLVLSEVYYPAGWNAYIDGTPAEIFKTNYILRSVVVPSGRHEVVFRFEPELYDLGWSISHAAWGLAILCVVIGLWKTQAVRRKFNRIANA